MANCSRETAFCRLIRTHRALIIIVRLAPTSANVSPCCAKSVLSHEMETFSQTPRQTGFSAFSIRSRIVVPSAIDAWMDHTPDQRSFSRTPGVAVPLDQHSSPSTRWR